MRLIEGWGVKSQNGTPAYKNRGRAPPGFLAQLDQIGLFFTGQEVILKDKQGCFGGQEASQVHFKSQGVSLGLFQAYCMLLFKNT